MSTASPDANQPPPLVDYDPLESDPALLDGLRREGGGWAEERVRRASVMAGGEALDWGRLANTNPPVLRTHDRYGERIDEVEFHPAWHQLMRAGVELGLHGSPWREPQAGSHVARAAAFMLLAQAESGFGCPISMTYAAVPVLRQQPEVAASWEPRLTSLEYDQRMVPVAEKAGALSGMAMTERQGGSDVRANTTSAEPAGGAWAITGAKWFCSAPMCDVFLVLAQTANGLSCFLLPRWRPDGTRNAFHIQRLKDKLGNRSNASSEVEFHGAYAVMVGPEGRGVPTIIQMVNHTRLDCVLGSTGLMRRATAEAAHHAAHRMAFGKLLADQPLMRNVLADLAVETEAATLTSLRLARAYDEAWAGDAEAKQFARLATAVSKYWVCKRTPPTVAEALECLGGNGFVEESQLPRLYRESPLNSIWEGSGNVIALDVLRAIAKSPESVEAFFTEIATAEGGDQRLDAYAAKLRDDLADATEVSARRMVERMALAFQGSLLVRHGDPAVAQAFVASRLEGDSGLAFGTLPPGVDARAIVERATPRI
ncbi:MAG TPA: acyl-CoA dehydrogenase family protein [Actinomycetota bacterium]|nr:acyl-CoA dehydrogenase family protein [Actinomycetota bacterium]